VLNGVVNDGVQDASTQASENKAGLFRVRQSLVVPIDAMSIRVGVHDRTNDRTGTLETALPIAPGSRESESRTRAPTLVRRGMILPG